MFDIWNVYPDLLKKVITGDESRVYGYDIEAKAKSYQWKRPEELRPKKARLVRSNVFCDDNDAVHHKFLLQDQ